jgi:hypothetical protein
MLEEVNKLCNFFLGLFHPSHVCKLYLDVPQALDLEALLVGQLGNNRVWSELAEDEVGEGNAKEGSDQSECVSKAFPDRIGFMVEVDLYLLELILLVVFEHAEEVVDVAIVPEVLR